MCAIIAINRTYDKIVVNNIFFNSRIRGLHSFGYSFIKNKKVVKKVVKYEKFIDSFI